jgi:hypothetical protein
MSESIVELLALIEPDWADVERRSETLRKQTLRTQGLLILGGVLAAAVLAGGAYAAARAIWSGHNMTPADINRQATTVYNDKWGECDGHGHCKTVTGTHKQITILPSMGVSFVLPTGDPAGDSVSIVPAFGLLAIPPEWGGPGPAHLKRPWHRHAGASFKVLRNRAGDYAGGVWTVPLPHGGERTITWRVASGSMTVRDLVDGQTATTALHAGDVVPLIPGSLAADRRSLDKAVIFDLPPGERVIIFPRLNQTYIDAVNPPPMAEPLAVGEAAKYGLTPIGRYNGKLPVTKRGGTWTAHLPGGLTRTIGWNAGDPFVTVKDMTATGTTVTQVPTGHEIPLAPFK